MAAGIPGLSMQDFASAGMARPSRQYRSMYERAGSTLDADSAALADQYAAYRAAQQAQGMANDAMYRSRMVEDRGFGEDARRFDLGRDDAMRRDTEAGRQFDSRMNVLRAILGGTTQPYAAAPSAPGGGVDVSMRGGAGYGRMGRGRGDGALRGQLNNYLAALLGGR